MDAPEGSGSGLLGNFSSRASQHRRELLEGISTLPQVGTPGRVLVYGEDAAPVVCGEKRQDVLMACAELGKGRIIVVSQDGYLTSDGADVAKLQLNMKRWVSHGTYVDDSDVCLLKENDDAKKLQGSKVAMWHGGACDITNEVLEFVMNGGGLLHGMTPWGWVQLNAGKKIPDMPLYDILRLVGICYTGEYMGTNPNGFNVEEALNKNGGLHICDDVDDDNVMKELLPSCGFSFSQLDNARYETNKWRHEILGGISVLPKVGGPGGVVVFKDHAYPVICGDAEEDVIIASAGVGKGRIVVLGHDAYVSSMLEAEQDNIVSKLHQNLKDWVSSYTYQDDSEIFVLRGQKVVDLPPGCQIILWRGGGTNDDEAQKVVANFLQQGGGLIIGMCPWGWLQLNPGTSLQDMPTSAAMGDAGLSFTSEYLGGNDDGYVVAKIPSGGFHLGHVLSQLDLALDLDVLTKNGQALSKVLHSLPEEGVNAIREKLERLYSVHAEQMQQCGPTKESPANEPVKKALMAICELLGRNNMGLSKVPGIEVFPGDFSSPPPLQSVDLDFESQFADYFSTGYYLPAGVEMTVAVSAMTGEAAWEVRVGAHTDQLYSQAVQIRWPNVCCKESIKADSTLRMMSPFGGLIYFVSTGAGSLKVQIHGVVESPYFDLTNAKSRGDWARRRQSPGLWADMAGKYITITVPSESVRDLKAPWEVMETWDRVVLAQHDLRGTHPSERRREFVVCDVQPSAGYMHAGHPIVTLMDVASPEKTGDDPFLLGNESILIHGCWGMFHEIGHNMQRSEWTFSGTGEVTNNIFTLYTMHVVCGIQAWIHKWLAGSLRGIEGYLNGGAQFEKWKKQPGIALGIYAQLAHHFGWEAYKKVFRKYESMESFAKPETDDQKIDTWITTFSQVVEYNLYPLFEFWGIPCSAEVKETLSSLRAWLPEDEMTKYAPERSASIRAQYPGCVAEI